MLEALEDAAAAGTGGDLADADAAVVGGDFAAAALATGDLAAEVDAAAEVAALEADFAAAGVLLPFVIVITTLLVGRAGTEGTGAAATAATTSSVPGSRFTVTDLREEAAGE